MNTNHYLKALEVLREVLPDTKALIEDHIKHRQETLPMQTGSPQKGRAFAAEIVADLIERLEEVRDEIKAAPLKRF